MKILLWTALISSVLLTGCDRKMVEIKSIETPMLGNDEVCQNYQGLPPNWQTDEFSGMIKIPAGKFQIGNNQAYPEERALYQSEREVQAFWIDTTEVTNAQFQSFVQATGYVTEAELQGEAAVFTAPTTQVKELAWWSLVKAASWKQPWGPDSTRSIQPNEPVRMITLKDALAYATWLGRELPNETQWEYAAKGFSQKRDSHPEPTPREANVWQGEFPYQNNTQDGYADVAPVGCYMANGFGLYDMIGNVWEYTSSPFTGTHDDHMGMQQLDQHQASVFNRYTIKGGSFLCAANYCMRYRASARHAQEIDLGISHVGFRTIKNIK